MEQRDDKKAGIPIPTLKDTLRPQLKIKGLQAGQSLLERLKQFKKKDLAFILAGLGVLFMAPLAEHFLMAPDSSESGAFKEGWGFKPGAGGLGQGGSPFEGGLNGLAPGGAAGGGSDVITPLNVRDPSALVMGPNAQQQAPATAPTPAPAAEPPKSSGSSDWKDALSQSAATAGKAATARASLPVPKVPLSNGGLRGLGVASGGGGGSFNVGPVQGAQFGRGGGGDSTGLAKGGRDFRGAATRGPGSANAGGFEQLKKNAAAAAGDISRAGSAVANLEQAAGRNMGGGQDGGGGGSAGANDKGPSGNQDKGSKSTGESLEFLRLKAEQDKAIELKWEMIKKKAMFPIELQQEMTKTLIMEPIKAIAGIPGKMMGAIGGNASNNSNKYVCTTPSGEFPQNSVNGPCTAGDGGAITNMPCCASGSVNCNSIVASNSLTYTGCSLVAGRAAATTPPTGERSPTDVPPTGQECPAKSTWDAAKKACIGEDGKPVATVPSNQLASAADLNTACKGIETELAGLRGTGLNADSQGLKNAYSKLAHAGAYVAASNNVMTNQTAAECKGSDGAAPVNLQRKGEHVTADQRAAYDKLAEAISKLGAANQKMSTVTGTISGVITPKSKAAHDALKKDLATLTAADVEAAKTNAQAVVTESEVDRSGDLQDMRTNLGAVVGENPEKKEPGAAIEGQDARPVLKAKEILADAAGDLAKVETALKTAGIDAAIGEADAALLAANANKEANKDLIDRLTKYKEAIKKAHDESSAGYKSLKQAQDYMVGIIDTPPGDSEVVFGEKSGVQSSLTAIKKTVAWIDPAAEGATEKSNLRKFGTAVKTEIVEKITEFKRLPTEQEKQDAVSTDPNKAQAKAAAEAVIKARTDFEAAWTPLKAKYDSYVGQNDNEFALAAQKAAVETSAAAKTVGVATKQNLDKTRETSKVTAPAAATLGPGPGGA